MRAWCEPGGPGVHAAPGERQYWIGRLRLIARTSNSGTRSPTSRLLIHHEGPSHLQGIQVSTDMWRARQRHRDLSCIAFPLGLGVPCE